MKIEKVFNNNVVQILGINNEEIIVMGKGLGFQKKPGDEVNQDLIEKYRHGRRAIACLC